MQEEVEVVLAHPYEGHLPGEHIVALADEAKRLIESAWATTVADADAAREDDARRDES